MNNGLKWAIPLAALFLIGGAIVGATRTSHREQPPTAVAQKETNYSAPQVSIMAQPMPAGTTAAMLISSQNSGALADAEKEKPKRRSRRRRHKRSKPVEKPTEKVSESKPDEEMGMMAADDVQPSSRPSRRKHKDETDDWKNWIAPEER